VPGEGQHVRFSYAASKEAIEKGVARMADLIRRIGKPIREPCVSPGPVHAAPGGAAEATGKSL